eukprot:1921664-Rhodomonas_salina.3
MVCGCVEQRAGKCSRNSTSRPIHGRSWTMGRCPTTQDCCPEAPAHTLGAPSSFSEGEGLGPTQRLLRVRPRQRCLTRRCSLFRAPDDPCPQIPCSTGLWPTQPGPRWLR